MRQALPHIVINFIVRLAISIICRRNQQRKHHKKRRENFYHICGKVLHIRNDGTVLRLLQRPIKNKYQCRKNGYAADYAKDNALRHDKAKVASKGEGHKAKRRKARNGCNGASYYGCQRFADCRRHGVLMVVIFLSLLVIAVPKEY